MPHTRTIAARLLLTAGMLAALVGMLCTCPGCVPKAEGPADTFGLDFTMPPDMPVAGALVFVVDGVNAAVFEEMLQAGQLPALRRYFVDRGLYAPRAIANTPSVTLANQVSLITGLYPGHHGIPGVNWFDRNQLIWRNYETIAQKNTLDGDYLAPTLFNRLSDQTTFSIFYQAHRGATKFVENWTSAGPPYYFGWYEYVDRLTLYRLGMAMDLARRRRQFPALTVAYLLAPDFRGYEHGVGSSEYRDALRHTDRQIGRVLGDVQRAGLLDRLVIALVSDHGMDHIERHLGLEDFLRRRVGLEVAAKHLWEKQSFEDRQDYYDRFSTVVCGTGDRYRAVCLRRPIRRDGGAAGWEAWTVRPTPRDLEDYPTRQGPMDLPKVLICQDAVDVLAYVAGPDRVRVRVQGGEVEFAQDGGAGRPITYRHVCGLADPLGWRGRVSDELLAGRPGSPRAWLEATAGTNHPDLPAQILAYFRSHLAGDIALFARPGYDFGDAYTGGHGGLWPVDMHTPMLLAGPGVPHRRQQLARTVDLVPTLLSLSGRPVPPGLDGASLVEPATRPAGPDGGP